MEPQTKQVVKHERVNKQKPVLSASAEFTMSLFFMMLFLSGVTFLLGGFDFDGDFSIFGLISFLESSASKISSFLC